MKGWTIGAVAVVVILILGGGAFMLMSSTSDQSGDTYTVTFAVTGERSRVVEVEHGGLVDEQQFELTRYTNAVIDSWTNPDTNEAWDFERDRVTKDITLYADLSPLFNANWFLSHDTINMTFASHFGSSAVIEWGDGTRTTVDSISRGIISHDCVGTSTGTVRVTVTDPDGSVHSAYQVI